MQFDPAEHLRRFSDRIARHRFINWTLSVHTRVDVEVQPALDYLLLSKSQVSLRDMWLCATARVLRDRPLFNLRFNGFRDLKPVEDIHLRVGLKLDDGRLGYVVVEHADRLNPEDMARRIAELMPQAMPPEYVAHPPRHRAGRLGRLVDDLEESTFDYAPHLEKTLGGDSGSEAGTFMVLDAGAFGAEDFHQLVLRPAVAVLVVMKPKSLLVKSPEGPVLTTRLPMAVPFCHKVMDTDGPGYFLFDLEKRLADPQGTLGAGRGEGGP
ncbi:MAG: hypothetical protein JRF33_08125 [Deltaproteobacteria bacterium]|nr:hypothetical protein [Deltaproteobacteria bacterium]